MTSWSSCQPLNNSDAGICSPIWAIIAAPSRSQSLCARAAKGVWRAANDTTGQLRFPAGADALALALTPILVE